MRTKVAASITAPDTQTCLTMLRDLPATIGAVEVRVDHMGEVDLPLMISQSPHPLIITCRPQREGGRFAGSEAERLEVLERAMDCGCAYVDVEWDTIERLKRRGGTKVMVSRHWYDQMPSDLLATYEALAHQADVVKLVGLATRPLDTLPIFELLATATKPIIAIAMAEIGSPTRILAPCFDSCCFTYGAISAATTTAPGQLTVDQLLHDHGLQWTSPTTPIEIRFVETHALVSESAASVTLSLPVAEIEAWMPVMVRLKYWLPRMRVVVPPSLRASLPPELRLLNEAGEL